MGKDESKGDGSSKSLGESSRPLLSGGPSVSNQPSTPRRSVNKIIYRQIFLGIVVSLPSLPAGMSFGFSAITLEELRLTVDQASWFASVTAMAFPIGALLVGPLMDKYGRRPALLSINVVSFVGWLLLSVHTSEPDFPKLIAGRILTGAAGGLASVPASVYAAECLCSTDAAIRSSLVAWSTVSLSAGIFLVFLTGAFLPYYAVASIATLIAIFSFILLAIFLPESPVWYTVKGRHGDAEWAQRELAVSPLPSVLEQPSEAEDIQPLPPPPVPNLIRLNSFRELAKPEAYKPLIIMTTFFFFQQFSGVYVMIAYMVDIVRSAEVVAFGAYTVTTIAGAVILCVALTASLIYPKTGVRSVAVISGIGTTITMIITAGFLAMRTHWLTRDEWYFLHWIPFFAILANVALSTLGFLILPWSMLGEVFPLSVKGLAGGIATFFGYLFKFVAVKLYPFMVIDLGVSGVFFFYGGMAFLGTLFVIIFLPETKGKTLQEIVDEFSGKRKITKKTQTAQTTA